MNEPTPFAFADPDALLQALGQALGREGPHPGLLPALLDGLERWDDPRLGQELLLLLQELVPRPGLPPPLLAKLSMKADDGPAIAVAAHGVAVYLLDTPITQPALRARLDALMPGRAPRRNGG